jgi:hypothetical protein
LEKLKTIEVVMAAIYTLISAVLTVFKFIKQLSKLKQKPKTRLA